jgi:hypothetical protein
MFMRFRGGGAGHLYMRDVEPWLDETGWGATWPSLSGKYQEPDRAMAPMKGSVPVPPPQPGQASAGANSAEHGSPGSDLDPGLDGRDAGGDDADGEDQEQPVDDDDSLDEEEDDGQDVGQQADLTNGTEDEGGWSEDDAEGLPGDMGL